MASNANIDAVVKRFLEAWRHPRSYAGGDIDETSGKYEDRFNAASISTLYAPNATIEWDGAHIGAADLDDAIRRREPFISNGYDYTTSDNGNGAFTVDIQGWLTSDASRPLQDKPSFQPFQGDKPFAERLVVDKDGRVTQDRFCGGHAMIEDGKEDIALQRAIAIETDIAPAYPPPNPSANESDVQIGAFLKDLYHAAEGYVRIVFGNSAGDRAIESLGSSTKLVIKEEFRTFFATSTDAFWGHMSPSPISYKIADWTLADRAKDGLKVQIRVRAQYTPRDAGAYYLDTLTLIPSNDTSRPFRVSDQKRESMAPFLIA